MMGHIMIVDDERDVVELIRFILDRAGHKVTTAFNGAEALAQLGVEPKNEAAELPDLIVLDVMMPVLDGYSVTARLGEEARTSSIPILVLTAKGDMRDLFQRASNVAAYIEKPFEPKNLQELIAGMLPAR